MEGSKSSNALFQSIGLQSSIYISTPPCERKHTWRQKQLSFIGRLTKLYFFAYVKERSCCFCSVSVWINFMVMRMANFKSVKALGLFNFWQGGEMG